MVDKKDTFSEQENIKKKRRHTWSFDINISEEENNDFLELELELSLGSRSRPSEKKPRNVSPAPPLPPLSSTVSPALFLSQRQAVTPQHPLHQQLSPTGNPFQNFRRVPALSHASDFSSSSLYLQESAGSQRPLRQRRNPSQTPRPGKSETVPVPYPWATDHRATIHSLKTLISRNISRISGEVQCKKCEHKYQMEYDLSETFQNLWNFFAENKKSLRDRAPTFWMNPVLPSCILCNTENSVKPIISIKKKSINWLFLLLGQMLGCCTLDQLKYYCKHTKNHRTGAKDRVLFLTYLNLCKQLDPSGPFDR